MEHFTSFFPFTSDGNDKMFPIQIGSIDGNFLTHSNPSFTLSTNISHWIGVESADVIGVDEGVGEGVGVGMKTVVAGRDMADFAGRVLVAIAGRFLAVAEDLLNNGGSAATKQLDAVDCWDRSG